MLRQEINLYHFFKEPSSQRNWLSADKAIFYISLFFLWLILVYIYSTWANHRLHEQVLLEQKRVAQLQNTFYQLRKGFPATFFTKDIKESVSQIQKEIDAQQQILGSLSNQLAFSNDLQILSQAIVPNVWLTSISISNGGDVFEINGNSLSIDNLQQFIGNLSTQPNFKNFVLTTDNIQKSTLDTKDILTFQISIKKKITHE